VKSALAAAGALAVLPTSSPASVIYSGIRNLSVSSSSSTGFDRQIEVDVDGDGLEDLGIFLASTLSFAAGSVGVIGDGSSFYAQRVGPGDTVGPIDPSWQLKGALAGVSTGPLPVEGPWAPPNETGALGFAFDAGGDVHYGWARARVEFNLPAGVSTATLIDWAYESQRETSIQQSAVPEPSTLALLALGAAGLAAVRARRKKA
jgi:hypothetical protein